MTLNMTLKNDVSSSSLYCHDCLFLVLPHVLLILMGTASMTLGVTLKIDVQTSSLYRHVCLF